MTIEIHTADVAVFANGRKVLSVTRPGTIMVAGRDGPATVEKAFQVGDVVLADKDERVLVPPLSFARATEIAINVIEGDLRVATDSQALRALATAVIGFAAQTVSPEPVAASVEAAA